MVVLYYLDFINVVWYGDKIMLLHLRNIENKQL